MEKDTQKTVNLEIKEIKSSVYELNYSGGTIILSRQDFMKMENAIKSLNRKIRQLEEEKNTLKKERDSILNKGKEMQKNYRNQIEKMKKEHESLEETHQVVLGKLEKFQKGNTKRKFTKEMQVVALRGKAKGMSVAQVHQEFMKKGIDISYETIRRFLSQS